MVAPPESVSLQLACRTGPNPSGTRLYFAHPSIILGSFSSLFGYFIFTQTVLGRAGSCKTGFFPLQHPYLYYIIFSIGLR